MPTLYQRNDSAYIVIDHHHQFRTWQIEGAGVRFLKGRGVREGVHFHQSLLTELVQQDMAYIGTRPTIQGDERQRPTPAPDEVALRERARELYQALYQGRLDEAYTFLWPIIQDSMNPVQFEAEFKRPRGLRLRQWSNLRVQSWPYDNPDRPEITRFGLVSVDLEVQDDSGATDKLIEYEEYWFRHRGVWFWMWRGWQDQSSTDKT